MNLTKKLLYEFSTFRRISLLLYFMKLVEFMKAPKRKTEFKAPSSTLSQAPYFNPIKGPKKE